MKKSIWVLLAIIVLIPACQTKEKKALVATFLTAKEAVLLNQLVYKPSLEDSMLQYAPGFEIVFAPKAVNGNFAFIAKKRDSLQYALVIRGSVIEFSNEGFQNFILQDFNIFNQKKWEYADSVQNGYLARGTYIGFQNLLQLRDISTGLSIRDFLEQKIPAGASLIITGHSLGGNLAYPMAGYLKKELKGPLQQQLQLISFGAPAAGNAAFVKDMEDKFPLAERYAIDKDIAPAFPDHSKMGAIAKTIGLDRVYKIESLSLDAGDLLDFAGEILEKTRIVNEDNKYVQSQLHLRKLKADENAAADTASTAQALFGRAYLFHRVDAYAVLLGGRAIE